LELAKRMFFIKIPIKTCTKHENSDEKANKKTWAITRQVLHGREVSLNKKL